MLKAWYFSRYIQNVYFKVKSDKIRLYKIAKKDEKK